MILRIFFIIVTVILGAILTVIVRMWAIKNNIVNKPNPIIPQHRKPIAYLGGAGIFLGIMVTITIAYFLRDKIYYKLFTETKPISAIICGSILFFAWGVYDDLKQLKPLPKFLGQLLCAIFCVSLGLETSIFSIPFIDYTFSVFWILFVVNALNFTDVCDGLVGSICAITFFLLAIFTHESKISCFIIAGATTGFLFFNLPKASIFLGDAGSLMLGFLLAAAGIIGADKLETFDSIIWMVFVAIVPTFELLFITVVRIRKGKRWWKGSPDHFALRMQKAGFKRWQVDAIAAFISAVFVSIACDISHMQDWLKYFLVAAAIMVFALIWKTLLKWEVEVKQ